MAKYGLTADEEKRYRAMFQAYDANSDGTLTIDEVRAVYRGTGWSPCRINHHFKKLDKDGSQRVDIDEFLQSMAPKQQSAEQKQQSQLLMQTFKTFDSDSSGTISRDELQKGLRNVYPKWTDQQIKERVALWMECDVNNDNQINYEEFIDIVSMDLCN